MKEDLLHDTSPNIFVRELSLDNGLRIILSPDKYFPVSAISIHYNLYLKNIELQKTGLPHFSEHITFSFNIKDQNISNSHDFITSLGCTSGATTKEDSIYFYSTFPKHLLPSILSIESKRMSISDFRYCDFSKIKEDIKKEREYTIDSFPNKKGLEKVYELCLNNTQYSKSIMGTVSDIDLIELDDVKRFYKEFYVPNNALLSIAGDFDVDEVNDEVNYYFSGIHKRHSIQKIKSKVPLKPCFAHFKLKEHNLAWKSFYIAFVSDPIGSKEDFILQLLENILKNSVKFGLPQLLINKKKIAHDVTLDYIKKNAGILFVLFIRVNRNVDLDDILREIYNNFKEIKRRLSSREILSAKHQIFVSLCKKLISPLNRSIYLASSSLNRTDNINFRSQFEKHIKISKHDIEMIIDKYFDKDNSTIVEIEP